MDDIILDMDQYLPLRDVVFHALRKAILTGKLKPGERLMEIHLAKQLGVSRTPVREAIHKLELEGLATMIPRRGAQVAQISEKGLKDVLELRRALDVFCAQIACERMTPEEEKELRETCKAFEEATGTKDTTVIAKADVAFHDVIINSTRNERLITTINNLAEQIYRYRFEYIKDDSQHSRLIEEHRRLVDAILNKDPEKAGKAAGIHIDNQEHSILSQINLED
ncbi:MAG: GntR family transcriptional regulator [Lachnospiraceae bacterium]|nr:GntR family transcriptional regulator [Lachnospiraceae bacterium]